ncbi:MAG: hypothetical protein KJO82_02295 [Gammaproteobacteria bacterium]|nr:hypothetical protein [Gammaproteobacteria bacterium]
MSLHFQEPGSFHDNQAVFHVGMMLRAKGQHRDAQRLFEMLARHIEASGEARSKELLLAHVRAQLAILHGESVANLVDNKTVARRERWWHCMPLRIQPLKASRAVAIAIYYVAVLGLCVSVTTGDIWITIPP